MKKLILLLTILSGQFAAQTDPLKFKKTFEIEIDPIAYLLKGYSVHGVYNLNHFRFDLGVFAIETPGSLIGNKGYEIRSSGYGLKVNYMFDKVNGLYAGLDFGYGEVKATNSESSAADTGHNVSLGAHLGYRIFLFPKSENALQGIYLTPWAGVGYNHFYDEIKFNDYKDNRLGYFATFHIGYRF
jgi:hypothetical protein